MIRGLGFVAAALAGAWFVACSSTQTATAKVVTVDDREAGSAAHDASEHRDARESGSIPEPAVCESIPATDDGGCPDADFLVGPCAPTGQRCLAPTPYPGVRQMFRCDADPYHPTRPPEWLRDIYFYDPGAMPPLPNETRLDTSDCGSRPVVPCACFPGEPRESAIERNGTISACQITNPIVFVTFDDTGCPVRAQYDNSIRSSPTFATCLTGALSGLRFDCASSATRVVLMTESKE
jgi:hypothetical protein